ncbi:hypothetical protein BJF87_24690 [Gordonia sp. CNJ-863]|uniref:hypothetical protein n=1 Tax=Gordonia sp. CNJ-863 TaxID=1904963 RepID=UPI00095C28E9|nr:hypothetical protein [Gordonia sp. CNJ-863]OLT42478.1 hypothetical protein BJF87_24690 [Gordonia sp. CNJ-863]
MNDTVTAYIRTYAPLIAGFVIGQAANIGLDLDTAQEPLVAVITVTAGAAYYALARLVGRRYPKVEAVMLGSSKTPTY